MKFGSSSSILQLCDRLSNDKYIQLFHQISTLLFMMNSKTSCLDIKNCNVFLNTRINFMLVNDYDELCLVLVGGGVLCKLIYDETSLKTA